MTGVVVFTGVDATGAGETGSEAEVECVTEAVDVLVVAGAVEWVTGAEAVVLLGGVVLVLLVVFVDGADVDVLLVVPDGFTPPTIDGAKFSACILLMSVELYCTPAPNTLLPKSVLDTLL